MNDSLQMLPDRQRKGIVFTGKQNKVKQTKYYTLVITFYIQCLKYKNYEAGKETGKQDL